MRSATARAAVEDGEDHDLRPVPRGPRRPRTCAGGDAGAASPPRSAPRPGLELLAVDGIARARRARRSGDGHSCLLTQLR